MNVKSRLGRSDPTPQTENDALFVRLNPIERRRQPAGEDKADQSRRAAPVEARQAEEAAYAVANGVPHATLGSERLLLSSVRDRVLTAENRARHSSVQPELLERHAL
jgi:hypothetical protein